MSAERRDRIRMTDTEVSAFLRSHFLMVIGTNGRDHAPHLVTMAYGFLGDALAIQAYPKSQKVVNLRRDPSITCLVEEGEDYAKIRGVQIVGRATILDDPAVALKVARSILLQKTGAAVEAGVMPQPLEEVTSKRVAIVIDVVRTVSWDHSRLAGAY